jgi:hypothetical protein
VSFRVNKRSTVQTGVAVNHLAVRLSASQTYVQYRLSIYLVSHDRADTMEFVDYLVSYLAYYLAGHQRVVF